MAISDWSTTPASNATVLGVNIGEGCPPSNVNDAIRKLMADTASGINFTLLSTFLSSTTLGQARTALGVPEGSTSLTAFGGLTNAANKLAYMTGSDAWATTDLTSFARTLLDDGDAATARTTLGAIGTTASSLANPGYVKLRIGSSDLIIQWGSTSISANGSTSVSYPTAFSTFSIPVLSARGDNDTNAQDNAPGVSGSSTTGFTVFSAADSAVTGYWIAIGV